MRRHGTQGRPTTARPQAGFTLVELLVVILVLSILVAVAGIPVSADGPGFALDLAEVQLHDAFDVAQTLSYSLGTPHGVAFDVGNERLAVVAQDGTVARDPLTHGAYVIDFTRLEQPRGIDIMTADFGPTGGSAIFDASGVPIAGGSVTITKSGVSRTFTLNAATGQLTGS